MVNKSKLDVVTLCGSVRKESYNAALVRALPSIASGDLVFKEGPSVADIPIYDGDLESISGFPSAITALAGLIREADGVIVVSPEYNYSVPGGLKNLLDRVSRTPNQPFSKKPVRWRPDAASSPPNPGFSQCPGFFSPRGDDRAGVRQIQRRGRHRRRAHARGCSHATGRIF
jgi:hypothetical protein